MKKRAIVLSDLHGQYRLLENALKHSKFHPKKDLLIVAGDTCDIGSETMRIHQKLQELEAIELVGNHEISHMCGIEITPYDVGLDPDYKAFIGLGISLGYFKWAHEFQGVLITHAGLPMSLVKRGFNFACEDTSFKTPWECGVLTAELAAKILNERLQSRVHVDEELMLLDIDPDPIWTASSYPFWFRPYSMSDRGGQKEFVGFFNGFKQVVGHTPWDYFNEKQKRLIIESETTMVDPYARGMDGSKTWFKYAVIEDGEVTLHKGA